MRRNLLLTFAALLASLAVHAATYYGFKIGGVPVTSDNYQNVTGSNIKTGTVVYDPSTMTVTLTNVTIERTGSDNRAIYNESKIGLRVKLVGTNILGAADAAPVRLERDTYFIVSSGTTTITGGSEGGIYITGGRTIWFEGPGTLIVNAEKKGGIEGSNDNNYVHFLNDLTASIYGGGGDLLNIYSVDFNGYNKFKEITLKSINSSTPNVKNVTTMLFGGKNVVQQPAGAEFNPSSKSIANYDYTNNAFLGDVKGSDIVISDKNVVALLDATNFPDAIFRSFLTQKFSKRFITTTNVANTNRLDLEHKGISNLQGVKYFTALKQLACHANNLTSLDVRSLNALTYITCYNNQLTTLNVSDNSNLENLYCENNQLTTLNLSNNKKLETLSLYGNKINGSGAEQFVQNLPIVSGSRNFRFVKGVEDNNELTLEQVQAAKAKGWISRRDRTGSSEWEDYEGVVYVNASNFPDAKFRAVVSGKDTDSNGKLDQDERAAVIELAAVNKGIASLQGIKYFTELTSLDVKQNNLGTLDLSQNTKLSSLSCWDNQLTTLDVSKCTQLQSLLCYENQLQQLDLTPNKALTQLICTDNKLTSLKVATQSFVGSVAPGVERRFQVFNNQLGSDAVDQFIASLDNRPTRKTYYVFTAGPDDQQMTTAQVQQSRAKGWWPMKVVNGDQAAEYEGVDKYPITIAGTQVTSDNKNGVTGDGITGTITYDPEANVLTLNNATITTSAVNAIRVEADLPGLNIKLVGNNTITMTANSKIAVLIDNCDGAVIEGPGKLQFNNAGAALYIDSGPGTGDHRMTIRNCEILANDPTTYSPSGTSIQDDQNSANITIENATVHLERGKINSGYDLQLVGCKISKPVGGFVYNGSICAPDDYSYEGEILIEPVSSQDVIGDINGDGTVDVDDMNAVINIMLGKADTTDRADVNADGTIDVDDMNAIINIMLGKS